ncbi:probable serine/threonine-protein kinase clkA isoform X3 [Spodoptera frugiperda]|uniref:Probable serine/threonine-protein kinase clkA isoform X1 n=1 Tax=Spodoptera frugiperda TaxID=7108 RepID=A0A9R0EZQ0_SPOFR|nr:probable serine/threonine-protein kinase clkA isoform X1 [Spodoptera frugiperda]XP_050555104.1 probable serine/threonine-protein kinase clkA isoform X2 [Spodoptera frugiperda]XP_050555105.1 probable serine/threonine-protein kinase clkA isoform X3 [Spodoptera frugiperda]
MVRLTVVIPFLFLVACVCTYPSKTPDNEELNDDRNNINNQSTTTTTYNYNNNGSGSVGQTQNTSITQHFGDINYGNGTSIPAHIVNINGGVANGGASYGSGNGGHGGFNTFYGDKHQKMHVDSGHEDKGGEGGKGDGQITTSEVVITKNNNNQENRTENNNQEPVTLLEAISSSNGPINMSITGGGSEAGAQSINDQNVRPGNNNSKKTDNEFNNEGAGDGSHDNGNDNGHEYTGGPVERWVWS